jgi:hypothetical protein
MVNENHRKF